MNHGTRSCYVGGCRCDGCRKANRDYARMRERRVTAPDVWGAATNLVPATEARRALEDAIAEGVPLRRIARHTGLSRHAINELRRGVTSRVRPTTYAAIKRAAYIGREAGDLTDATATWRLLEALIRAGYTKKRLAQLLGRGNALQIRRTRIRVSTERAVRELYDRLIREDAFLRIRLGGGA